MAADARKMRDLLVDPSRTAFHLVTLAEEMPCNEAVELDEWNQRSLGMPTGALVINQVWDPSLMKDESTGVQPKTGEAGVAATLEYLNERARNQTPFVEKLKGYFGERCISLPFLGEQPFGPVHLEVLSHSLSDFIDVE